MNFESDWNGDNIDVNSSMVKVLPVRFKNFGLYFWWFLINNNSNNSTNTNTNNDNNILIMIRRIRIISKIMMMTMIAIIVTSWTALKDANRYTPADRTVTVVAWCGLPKTTVGQA